jgi:predicted DNA-binding transcriptional regulator AlpA
MEKISKKRRAIPGHEPTALAVSVPTAARMCGLSPATYWGLMRDNKAPRGFYIGGRRLLLVAELQRWLVECSNANQA